jgi:hypothetical protein
MTVGAHVVGVAPNYDPAMIRLKEPRQLQPAIMIGTSADLNVGQFAFRAKAAEATLAGKAIDEDLARAASSAALQGAVPLSKNAYKLSILETLVRRAVLAAARGA